MSAHFTHIETLSTPITAENLPEGPRWEEDGACWTAIADQREPTGWRWRPNNMTAFAKPNGPDGEMTDFAQPVKL